MQFVRYYSGRSKFMVMRVRQVVDVQSSSYDAFLLY